jgi:hypothetical protein
MIHVFLLIVLANGVIVSQDMYFRSINVCNAYAESIVVRKNPYSISPYVSAYCIPKLVEPEGLFIYDK